MGDPRTKPRASASIAAMEIASAGALAAPGCGASLQAARTRPAASVVVRRKRRFMRGARIIGVDDEPDDTKGGQGAPGVTQATSAPEAAQLCATGGERVMDVRH